MKYSDFVEFEEINTDLSINEDIMVTLWCNTYNHSQFIEDALFGFINQKTNYNFEVIVFDDASTDGTSEIVRDYAKKHPNLIKAYIAKKNTYGTNIRRQMLNSLKKEAIHGEYIALCEGDDYWIDEHKLQKQVDYLENHVECSLTGHCAKIVNMIDVTNDSQFVPMANFRMIEGIVDNEEIILRKDGPIPTASFVMRKEVYFKEKDFPQCDIGDWPTLLFAITKGYIYYFKKEMSVYRYLTDNSWTKEMLSEPYEIFLHNLKMVIFFAKYDIYTNSRYTYSISKVVRDYMLLSDMKLFDIIDNKVFDDICDKTIYKLQEEDQNEIKCLIKEAKRIWGLMNNYPEYEYKLKDYINKYDNIVIYGDGKYAEIVETFLKSYGISGIKRIVSDNISNLRNGVIHISDYDGIWEKTGVIVALHHKWEDDILPILFKHNINNYYAPFWLNDFSLYGFHIKINKFV